MLKAVLTPKMTTAFTGAGGMLLHGSIALSCMIGQLVDTPCSWYVLLNAHCNGSKWTIFIRTGDGDLNVASDVPAAAAAGAFCLRYSEAVGNVKHL